VVQFLSFLLLSIHSQLHSSLSIREPSALKHITSPGSMRVVALVIAPSKWSSRGSRRCVSEVRKSILSHESESQCTDDSQHPLGLVSFSFFFCSLPDLISLIFQHTMRKGPCRHGCGVTRLLVYFGLWGGDERSDSSPSVSSGVTSMFLHTLTLTPP